MATLGFAAAVAVAAVMAGVSGAHRNARTGHVYPPNPRSFERPKVNQPAPRASTATTLKGPLRIGSLAVLARALPPGALRGVGANGWRLTVPVDVTRGAEVSLTGGTLLLADGAFLQARAGGSLTLEKMTVATVGHDGSPAAAVSPGRGFLVGRDGGRLVLRDDRIRRLGHLGTVAYGISLRAPAPGSAVVDCSVDGNYFGIFLSHAAGVTVVGNTVADSVVYGIDPYGGSHDDLIAHNTISRAGLHGIVLADGVSRIRVVANRILDPGAHGVVLYDGAHANTIQDNTITRAFDGIVLTNASANRIVANTVDDAHRFGLRVSGGSAGNTFDRNTILRTLLGAYFYGGASGNSLAHTTFAGNGTNVRVRADAPHNRVVRSSAGWRRP